MTRVLGLVTEFARTEQDLRDAVASTTRDDGQQIEVQLGHLCNNKCVFCVSGQRTQEGLAGPIPAAPAIAVLEEARARGVRRVTILGGEPTIHPSFLDVLRRARDLGFEEIVIFTNGVRGRQTSFLEEALALGDFTWRISIQGGTAESHDAVTRRPGSFAKILAALELLSARGADITANMCVTEDSYRSLPRFPELVARYGIRQLHVDLVRPDSTGRRDDAWLERLMPRLVDMAPYIARMLEEFDRLDPAFDVNIGNLPFCVLPAWSHKIHHGGQPTLSVTTDDLGRLGRIWDKYEYQRADAVYASGCADCALRSECRGVAAKYARLKGLDELRPISPDQLAALRRADRTPRTLLKRERRDLARLLRAVQRLRRTGSFAGWRYASSRSLPDGDGVVVAVEGAGDERLELSIRAPLRVAVALGPGTDPVAARPVVTALRTALSGS